MRSFFHTAEVVSGGYCLAHLEIVREGKIGGIPVLFVMHQPFIDDEVLLLCLAGSSYGKWAKVLRSLRCLQ